LFTSTAISTNVAIANTETNVVQLTIPAGSLALGSTYRIIGHGVRTGTNTQAPTINVRIGQTNGTPGTDSIAVSPTIAGTATASNFFIEAYVTVRSTGSTGTILGGAQTVYGATTAIAENGTAVALNTTVNNYLKLTLSSGNASNTYSFYVASIEQVV
jgi:hypothetical protein